MITPMTDGYFALESLRISASRPDYGGRIRRPFPYWPALRRGSSGILVRLFSKNAGSMERLREGRGSEALMPGSEAAAGPRPRGTPGT